MLAQSEIAALAKAGRAAIILPGLLAILMFCVKHVEAAGFAIFGTFAHLVMTNYAQQQKRRVAQAISLTCCGLVMIAWGTAVSIWLWFAVLSACVVGFTTQTASIIGSSIVASRTVVLLAFMLAVTSPTTFVNVIPRLAGWLLSGVVALLILLTTWISFNMIEQAQPVTRSASTSALVESESWWRRQVRRLWRSFQAAPNAYPNWFDSSARAAIAMGVAVLIAKAFQLEHGFWIVLGILPTLRAGETAQARTFLQQQGGTLAGFMISAMLVFVIQAHPGVYWICLPITAFVAAYASTAMGFAAGQAAFTVFVIVLLNILAPLGYRPGVLRVEDIAIGGAISLVLGAVYPVKSKASAPS
jgi:Fusaric acid resistance protein-like